MKHEPGFLLAAGFIFIEEVELFILSVKIDVYNRADQLQACNIFNGRKLLVEFNRDI